MPFAATWMDLEVIMLGEIDRERRIPYDFTYMWNIIKQTKQNKYKLIDTESRLVITRGEGGYWGRVKWVV